MLKPRLILSKSLFKIANFKKLHGSVAVGDKVEVLPVSYWLPICSPGHLHTEKVTNITVASYLVFAVSVELGLSLNYLKCKGGNTFEPLIRYYCSYKSFFRFEFRRLRFYFLGRDEWGDEYRIRMRFRAEIGSLNCCSNRNLVKNLDFWG